MRTTISQQGFTARQYLACQALLHNQIPTLRQSHLHRSQTGGPRPARLPTNRVKPGLRTPFQRIKRNPNLAWARAPSPSCRQRHHFHPWQHPPRTCRFRCRTFLKTCKTHLKTSCLIKCRICNRTPHLTSSSPSTSKAKLQSLRLLRRQANIRPLSRPC